MTQLFAPRPAPARPDAPPVEATPAPRRIVAIDAIRGLAIVVMLLNGNPGPRSGLPDQLKHPAWHGLTFADLFFPLFLFAVGASMAFSSRATSARSILRRAALLVVLGIALGLVRSGTIVPQGVLQHIAVAYVLAWLVLKAQRRVQPAICGAALLAYWAAFVAFADGDPWRKGDTVVDTINTWVFGSFRTEGLPQTVISTVTIVAGAWVARRFVEGERGRAFVTRVGWWAAASIGAGLLLSALIPLNKRLWTPSFALLVIGSSCAFFALFYWLADVRGWRRPVQPLVVLGCNAIAVYVVFIGLAPVVGWVLGSVRDTPGVAVALVSAAAWTVLGWGFTRELYRRRIFVKV